MKVLSLFDGISCARVALERAKINVEAYYASEIDKYAIQISQKNYSDIIQVGSVVNLNKHSNFNLMETIEKTQNKLRSKIRECEIELGERTKALYAQEPYKDLTHANSEVYKMIKGEIGRIEKNIEILENVITYGDNPTYTNREEHPTEDSYDNDHDNKLVDEYYK